MSRLLILFFCAIAPLFASAQVVDEKVEKFIAMERIDTFMVYSFPCYRGMVPLDSCKYEDPKYLFWQTQGHFYVKAFDYCNTYRLVELDSTSPLRFYLVYRHDIDHETIKPPTCYVYKQNKGKIDTLKETSMVDHSCYHTLILRTGHRLVNKQADIYDLEFVKFDDGRRNIFYAYNNGTKLKALIDRTAACLGALKKGFKFMAD